MATVTVDSIDRLMDRTPPGTSGNAGSTPARCAMENGSVQIAIISWCCTIIMIVFTLLSLVKIILCFITYKRFKGTREAARLKREEELRLPRIKDE